MNLLLAVCVVGVATLAAAGPVSHVPIELDYHEKVGIPEAARIKAAELGLDFDGARIAGGSPAVLGQFPYLGGLVIHLADGRLSMCGSSLLTNTRLVTAAHCWEDRTLFALSFTVVLGSVRLHVGGTRINTNQVTMHSGWDPSTISNDIAMITIGWVNYDRLISPISLPAGTSTFADTWASAAGFGRIGAELPTYNAPLMHVNLKVISNEECQETFGRFVIHSTICTSGAGGVGICSGDSGGPLAVPGPTLIGVTSFGSGAGCHMGFAAAYARVSSFIPWIHNHL